MYELLCHKEFSEEWNVVGFFLLYVFFPFLSTAFDVVLSTFPQKHHGKMSKLENKVKVFFLLLFTKKRGRKLNKKFLNFFQRTFYGSFY